MPRMTVLQHRSPLGSPRNEPLRGVGRTRSPRHASRLDDRGGRVAGLLLGALAFALAAGAVAHAIYRLRAPAAGGVATAGESASRTRPDTVGPVLPGVLSVTDAVLVGEEWVLLDRRAAALHWLDSAGRLAHSTGRPGDGPGELRNPAHLVRLGDTLLVASLDGGRIDYFTLAGEFVRRTPLESSSCGGGMLLELVGAPAPGLFGLRQCIDVPRGWVTAEVTGIGPSGLTERIASFDVFDIHGRAGHPYHVPVLSASEEHLLIGTVGRPCVTRLSFSGQPIDEICYPLRERVPLSQALKDELAEARRSRPMLSAPAYSPPEYLPAFDAVFPSGGRLVWRVVTGEETRALDVWDASASPERRGRPLPQRVLDNASDATFLREGIVLVAREWIDGVTVAVFRLTID